MICFCGEINPPADLIMCSCGRCWELMQGKEDLKQKGGIIKNFKDIHKGDHIIPKEALK